MDKRFVRGDRIVRRILRNVEPASRSELNEEFEQIGNRLLGNALAETPRRHGGLVHAIQKKITIGASMILRLGLLTKRDKSSYFYGYILDQGRKAQTVRASRIRADGTRHQYDLKVGPISRDRFDFVFGRRRDFEVNELPKLRGIWNKILGRASAGVSDD